MGSSAIEVEKSGIQGAIRGVNPVDSWSEAEKSGFGDGFHWKIGVKRGFERFESPIERIFPGIRGINAAIFG
jgi:hypothetical protein